MKKSRNDEGWYVYILLCGDGTLYTGIAKDYSARLKAHMKKKGARYTKTRLPLKLKALEYYETQKEALIREKSIKKLARKKKEALLWRFRQPLRQPI